MIRRAVSPLLLILIIGQLVLPVHGLDLSAGTGNSWSEALTPFSVIGTNPGNWEQLIGLLAPFLALVVLGIILIERREQRKGRKQPLPFWLATVAGLMYLGGAAIVFVQLFRELHVSPSLPIDPVTPAFAIIGMVLGVIAVRTARSPTPGSLRNRLILVAIGVLGLVFWSGLVIGPVLSLCAAVVPARTVMPSFPPAPGK
jgi:uncharacterized membrane protein HdeD (DUF308 family)